ncbi:MAG TPA: heavy-metal-associated domain-containing protein [Polyangiaceae bacterium]|nr:heavy-metal-associated domain-containing protein [Polyangiaceae bacterium]
MIELKVTGMTCNGCVNSVRRAIERVAPNSNPQIELASGRVQVDDTHAKQPSDVAAILSAIESAGFEVEAKGS